MAARRRGRVYLRGRRWWGDFRDLGGGQEALIPEGEKRATMDRDVADALATARVDELKGEKRRQGRAYLLEYAARHLELKAKGGEAVPSWLRQSETHLREAVEYFGEDLELVAITPEEVTRYVEHLRRKDNGRGGTLTDTSVRKYLNSLSNLFKRALSERYVSANPVADMYSKPTEERVEADFLEPAEAGLLLEAARTYRPAVELETQGHGGAISANAQPHLFPILATFLLTGGRKSEVLGLEVDDVSFRLGKVYFRTNDWRRLKTRGSKRSVPLWPQLREVLEAYVREREASGGLGRLLFPSVGGRPRKNGGGVEAAPGERMIRDLRRSLDTVAARAGFPAGHVRLHMLRHTYTAARIQTLDRGAPVSLFTVARELGHRSTQMIEDRYGHLHDRAITGGSEVVEFQVETHRKALRERLEALGSGEAG